MTANLLSVIETGTKLDLKVNPLVALCDGGVGGSSLGRCLLKYACVRVTNFR